MATAARRGTAAVLTALLLLIVGAAIAVVGGANAVLPEADDLSTPPSERDLAMAWTARALLLLAAAWLIIGILSARTRLVRRPGAAAARASWISATRPWRARESTLGMLPLDRWLMVLVPGALLVATRAVQTSFVGWVHGALALGAWLVFAAAVRLVAGRRSPWPVIAAVGGAVVLRCIIALIALSVIGPGGYGYAFWADPVPHEIYLALAVALFLWTFVAAGWALTAQLGAPAAVGTVLAAVGAAMALPAVVIVLVGPAAVIAAWSDELVLVPWTFSRVVDVAVALDIPLTSVWIVAGIGAVMIIAGLVLALPRRRPARAGVGGRA